MAPEFKPLSWFLKNLKHVPDYASFWVPTETSELYSDLSCIVVEEDIDLSDEELRLRESKLKELGLKELLSKEQIEDVEGNLRAQVTNYNLEDLISATDYYWKHDAYSVANNA